MRDSLREREERKREWKREGGREGEGEGEVDFRPTNNGRKANWSKSSPGEMAVGQIQ